MSARWERSAAEAAETPVILQRELPDAVACPAHEHGRQEMVRKLSLLWQRRSFLFRAAVIGLASATLVAFLIPKQYESTTRLMPPDDGPRSEMALVATLAGKGGLGALAGDVLGLKSSGDLFVGILKSRTVQDDVVEKFDLRKIYGKKRREDARRELASNSSISEDRKSGIITVVVTDRDPRRAAAMAQQYLDALNTVVSGVSTSSARRERIFLEERLQQVKQDLETAERDFSDYASKTGAIDIKEQGKAMLVAAATLQGELIAAESQLEGLRQIYTDNNVRIRSVRARVAELRAQLEKVGGKQDVTNEAASSKDDSLYPSIRKLPVLGVTYADLYRRTRVQEAVFETLTQEYELAKVAEAKEIPSVKVLDSPNVPEKNSFPPRLAIVFLGISLSLCLAGAWVLGSEGWATTDPLDPRKKLAKEIFNTANASMPWAEPNGSRFQAATHKVWTRLVARNGARQPKSSLAAKDP